MDKSFNNLVKNGCGISMGISKTISDVSSTSSRRLSPEVSFGSLSYPQNNDLELSSGLFTPSSTDFSSTTDASFSSLLIGNILTSLSLQDDTKVKKKITCTCDDGNKANFYCRDCQEYLCQKCVSAHYRVSLTKKHNIVKASDYFGLLGDDHYQALPYLLPPPCETSNNYCNVHSGEVLHLFCDTCSCAICTQCTLYEHIGHSVQYLQQAVECSKTVTMSMLSDAKSSLQSLGNKIADLQGMLERVVGRSKLVESEIHNVIHKHMVALEQRERDLIGKVEQIRMFKCQVLSAQMDSLQLTANKLKTIIEDVNETIASGSSLEILKAKEKIQAGNAACPSNVLVAEDENMLFAPPDPTVYLALSALGDVKSSICAQQTLLIKDGSSNSALCGSFASFTIHARDHSGEAKHDGSDIFDINIRKPDNTIFRGDVLHSSDGRYLFRVHVTMEGEYVVSVRCRGMPICESPYILNVKRSVNYAARAASGTPIHMFGKEGDKPGELCRPWGICCDLQGHLIVADRSNNRLQIFNPDGTFHHMFGSSGSRPGQFDRPAGVAADNKGNIIVADKDNHRIQIFRFDGTFVSTFGERGSKNGQFNYPWDVDMSASGVIAVTDTRNHRIQLFSIDGTFLSKYGFEGAMWKHFDSPRGVAFTRDGRLFVTDFNNHRLVIIQPDMQSARYLGSEGSQTLQFLRPQGVAIDEEGNIVVADSRNHRIQVFTPSGGLIAVFGGNLQTNSLPQMDRPSGITVTPDGHIAVIDFGNNRVMIF